MRPSLRGVGGEVVDVRVAAGREHDRVPQVRAHPAVHEVAHDDPSRLTRHDHQVEHLGARMHLDGAGGDLAGQGLVGAEQQLLAGLATRVEGARYLHSAKRAGREQAAVLAGERHALGGALVDDARADFREPIHVRLARAEVAPLDRVVEQPEHGVAVVLIVLRRVDPALGRDRVGAPRRVLETEARHLIAELAERGRGGGAGEPRADDQDAVFELVRGIHELDGGAMALPLLGQRARRDLRAQLHAHCTTPPRTARGIAT